MLRSRYCFCVLCAVLGLALAFVLFALAAPSASAQAPAAPAKKGPVSFINDVAPILKESCFGCHGAKNPKGKLDMTRYDSLRKGGTKDDPIVAGQPDDSYLIDVLTAPDSDKKRMPPKDNADRLPKEQVAVIERWIKEGAKLDADIKGDADLLRELRVRWVPPPPPAAYPFPVTVTALAFTPDGKKLVVSGHHELTVWDVATARPEKRVRTRARRAMALVFLPDGKLAVAGGRPGEEGELRVYDLNGGTARAENGVVYLDGVNAKGVMVKQLIGTLDTDDEVLCLALSPDGKKLASGGCDRTVHVWDISAGVATAKLEQSVENHADWVFGVAFSPDGKQLLTASRDKTAKVWDLAAKESVLTFPDHQNGVYGVAAKADGKFGYSVGEDGNLRSWNAKGEQAGKQVKVLGGHGKPVLKLAAQAAAKPPLLATCGADFTVKLWNADSGQALKTLAGNTDYVYAVALSPDGSLVASGAFNGEVRVWKVADGSLVKAFNATPGMQTASAAPPAPPTPAKPAKKK
jgi:WD40 repeat protein/mono/diheme cytochrome c family protein